MTVDDTIYRQAVLDLINANWTYEPLEIEINCLPSAQPEITDEQAIEHLRSTGWMQNHDREMYDMGLKEQLADDSGSYDSLLPSAQQEIIFCKDCKKHNIAMGDHLDLGYNKYHWYEKSEVCPLIDMRGKAQGHEFDYQFCAYAERKTDD